MEIKGGTMEKHDRIKLMRILNGHTQASLAISAQIKQASVASYERGKYGCPELVLKSLAIHLNTDPAYLAFGYPALEAKVWEPSKEAKGIVADIKSLMPSFILENKFSDIKIINYLDGDVILFTSQDNRRCLLFCTMKDIATHISMHISTQLLLDINSDKSLGRISTGKLLREFDIKDLEIEGLSKDYFSWPPDFGSKRHSPDLQRILSFILDEALPDIIHEAILIDYDTKYTENFLSSSSFKIRRQIELAVDKILTFGWSSDIRDKLLAGIQIAYSEASDEIEDFKAEEIAEAQYFDSQH